MEFFASTELRETLEHLMDYFSHQNFERDLGVLIELLADHCMKEMEKKYELRVSAQSRKAGARMEIDHGTMLASFSI